ncbi:hypothetical protein CS063_10855 [Sporanaerobium hydrogeniformans]|uniref:Uncharacterized protein n=1 Tax=Sporanaerobium hydrogeniformans TaxID=3072179 RepID=A0AC61DCJ5_9FIRM|nr:peptidylprolyl isomerase [Sporanaerobium hydrogeniformans]PHV70371.1 hypothetical protein CS063_10855 [Sporanaerobium hydrogeniformans]
MKKVKKIVATMLMSILSMSLLVGCGGSEKAVLTVNNEKVTEPVYRLYLWTIQQRFESLTPNIWDMDLEGKKTEDVAKDRALDSIKVSIAAKEKAKELGVELSAEEKDTIKSNAKEIMTTRTDLVKELSLKQRDVETFLNYGVLIDKVTEKISESYVPNEKEVEDEVNLIKEQYETATAKHVLIKTQDDQGNMLPEAELAKAKALAEEVLAKALAGEDMAELAKTYSEDGGSKDKGGEYTFGKGKMVPQFEEVAFVTGKVGEVYPKLVETSYGYHIMKVEARSTGDAETIKKDAEANVKARFAQTELTELSESMKVEKTEAYEAIRINRKESAQTTPPEGTPATPESTPATNK